MKKYKDIKNYKDLIKRSKSIKNIYDVFDMVHEDMTADEVKQACLNLYALKLRENPKIIYAFKKIIPNSLPYSDRKFYEKQQQIIKLSPIFFSEEEFNKYFNEKIDTLPKGTSAMFLTTHEIIIVAKEYFDAFYKENPFNILIAVYHELEHMSQKYELDQELRTIYSKNRLAHYVINEETVEDLLLKNRNNISKAMKEFKKLPDDKKYVDLFDFVNIKLSAKGNAYDYTIFDLCLEQFLPEIENKLDNDIFEELNKQFTLANSNFYINSPVEQDAKLYEMMFGFCMSSYAKNITNDQKRRDWIVKKLEETNYCAFCASDHKEAEGLFDEMMSELTLNEKINYVISKAKNSVQDRKKARETIARLFKTTPLIKLSKEEYSSFKNVGIYYFVACFENGLIPEELSCQCIEIFDKLVEFAKYREYKKDSKILEKVSQFVNKYIIATDEELEDEIFLGE